jgi:hypothetical protein
MFFSFAITWNCILYICNVSITSKSKFPFDPASYIFAARHANNTPARSLAQCITIHVLHMHLLVGRDCLMMPRILLPDQQVAQLLPQAAGTSVKVE